MYFLNLFPWVKLKADSSAKAHFTTTEQGETIAAGVGSSMTGFGAGIKDILKFGGALYIDDSIKPGDAFSETIRNGVNDWYSNTVGSRLNDQKRTAIVAIGQRVHENDLANQFITKADGNDWRNIVLPVLHKDGKPLDPILMPSDVIEKKKESDAYTFSSQYQQRPIAIGDRLYFEEDFPTILEKPVFKSIFITGDTAQTDKKYNDASAFSAWGLFDIIINGVDMRKSALVWLDCIEIRVIPDVLLSEVLSFYTSTEMKYGHVDLVVIEDIGEGKNLNSHLRHTTALKLFPLKREARVSKMDRLCKAQPTIHDRRVCFLPDAPHKTMVIEHMVKITKKGAHAHDDIADTCADAVNLGLIDNLMQVAENEQLSDDDIVVCGNIMNKKVVAFDAL